MSETLKSIIRRARDYYFNQWRGKEKICPAFGEKVYLTRVGWHHIAYHPRRTLVDKKIRLKKLPLAREVLEKATTYQTLQKRGQFYLFGFTAIRGDTRVKVVVSSKGENGKKILYSVMFKSLIRQEQRNIEQQNRKIIAQFKRRNHRIFPKRRK
jgi:hypothetical protein